MPKRKRLFASQKAQIVLEAIREEKSVSQIAAENSIHPNQIHKWKKQALEEFAQLFEHARLVARDESPNASASPRRARRIRSRSVGASMFVV